MRIEFTPPAGNALPALRAAVAELRKHPGSTLFLPPGDYLLDDPAARNIQRDVMAGKYGRIPSRELFRPGSPFVSALDFTGCRDATVEAHGANFRIDGFMEVLSVQHCSGVTIKGLSIDYLRKPYSRGVVVSDSADFLEVKVSGQTMISAELPISRMALIRRGRYDRTWECPPHEYSGDGIFRFPAGLTGCRGEEIVFIHMFHYRPAILVYEAENTLLEDVTIFSQPGMGVVGHRSADTVMRRLRVVPAPGEPVSSNTDATHFASCRGLLRYEACWFEGQTDDSANVHTYYHRIVRTDGRKLETACRHTIHSLYPDYPDVGDTVELSDAASLELRGTHTVLSREWDEARRVAILELDPPLPENAEGMLLADVTQLPRLEFLGCVCRNHMARGILVRTRSARIEDCLFDGTVLPAIHIAAEVTWDEAAACRDVTVRRNRVVRCGTPGCFHDTGGVVVDLAAERDGLALHRDIVIEENVFDCRDLKHAVYAANTDGLRIAGNRMCSQEEPVVVAPTCLHVQSQAGGRK